MSVPVEPELVSRRRDLADDARMPSTCSPHTKKTADSCMLERREDCPRAVGMRPVVEREQDTARGDLVGIRNAFVPPGKTAADAGAHWPATSAPPTATARLGLRMAVHLRSPGRGHIEPVAFEPPDRRSRRPVSGRRSSQRRDDDLAG